MSTATLDRTFETADLRPRIGTEVKMDAETIASGRYAKELRALLEKRGVLVFKKINLTKEQQRAFARSLGVVTEAGDDGIQPLIMDKAINPVADYQRGAVYWHIDGATGGLPNFAAMLSGHVLPPSGGQTEFTNTYAAWEDLPDDEKTQLRSVRVVHSLEAAQRMVVPEPSYEELKVWQGWESQLQPLVWKHRDGRESLVLGGTASHIPAMELSEGRLLLTKLLSWATKPEYVYSHEWDVGDLIVWDNTGTMHRVLPYDFKSGRLLHRTTIEGEEMLQ